MPLKYINQISPLWNWKGIYGIFMVVVVVVVICAGVFVCVCLGVWLESNRFVLPAWERERERENSRVKLQP